MLCDIWLHVELKTSSMLPSLSAGPAVTFPASEGHRLSAVTVVALCKQRWWQERTNIWSIELIKRIFCASLTDCMPCSVQLQLLYPSASIERRRFAHRDDLTISTRGEHPPTNPNPESHPWMHALYNLSYRQWWQKGRASFHPNPYSI